MQNDVKLLFNGSAGNSSPSLGGSCRRRWQGEGSGTVMAAAGEETTGRCRASAWGSLTDGRARHGYERIIGRGAQRLQAAAVGARRGKKRLPATSERVRTAVRGSVTNGLSAEGGSGRGDRR